MSNTTYLFSKAKHSFVNRVFSNSYHECLCRFFHLFWWLGCRGSWLCVWRHKSFVFDIFCLDYFVCYCFVTKTSWIILWLQNNISLVVDRSCFGFSCYLFIIRRHSFFLVGGISYDVIRTARIGKYLPSYKHAELTTIVLIAAIIPLIFSLVFDLFMCSPSLCYSKTSRLQHYLSQFMRFCLFHKYRRLRNFLVEGLWKDLKEEPMVLICLCLAQQHIHLLLRLWLCFVCLCCSFKYSVFLWVQHLQLLLFYLQKRTYLS